MEKLLIFWLRHNMKSLKLIIGFFICLCIIFFQSASALAWTVSPVRFEIKGEKGKEYTLTFSVLNESQLYEKRFQIQLDDWTIDSNNDFLRKAFNKQVDNKYSAISWIKVTPTQFVVPPGETKSIRFTVTVPNEIPGDGEFAAGIFVGERNIELPPKGEKIVHIKQDTFIGVIVYVKIGEENSKVTLTDFSIDVKPIGKGLSKVVLLPVFENQGNVHSRAQLTAKLEPISNLNKDEVPKEFIAGELVVLRGSMLSFPIEIPKSLPVGSEWKFTVSADFGRKTPVLVGTKRYKIPHSP